MSLEFVQKFSVFSLVLECMEMHCFSEMLVFITVLKGSLVSFHCAKFLRLTCPLLKLMWLHLFASP